MSNKARIREEAKKLNPIDDLMFRMYVSSLSHISTYFTAYNNQRPRSKLTGYQTCNAASCGVFDPRGIRQMLVQARHLAHCSRE